MLLWWLWLLWWHFYTEPLYIVQYVLNIYLWLCVYMSWYISECQLSNNALGKLDLKKPALFWKFGRLTQLPKFSVQKYLIMGPSRFDTICWFKFSFGLQLGPQFPLAWRNSIRLLYRLVTNTGVHVNCIVISLLVCTGYRDYTYHRADSFFRADDAESSWYTRPLTAPYHPYLIFIQYSNSD